MEEVFKVPLDQTHLLAQTACVRYIFYPNDSLLLFNTLLDEEMDLIPPLFVYDEENDSEYEIEDETFHNLDEHLDVLGIISLYVSLGTLPGIELGVENFGLEIYLIFSITIPFLVWCWTESVYYHKIHFLLHFLPLGITGLLLPIIIILEIISHCSRLLSLAIRLFANTTAGHLLLDISVSFIFYIMFQLVANEFIFTSLSCFLIFFHIIIIILELVVGCVQSYVFGLLLGLYYDEYLA